MKVAFSRRRFQTRKREYSEPHAQSSLMMQKFLANLLIFFALGLCALCAFQWVRESHLRKEIADLQHTVYLKLEAIQNLEAQLRQTKTPAIKPIIAELTGLTKPLGAVMATSPASRPLPLIEASGFPLRHHM